MVVLKKHPAYQSPVVTFYPPLPKDDQVYSMQDDRLRSLYEQSRNPLYVMEAFFRRYADMTVGRDTSLDDAVSFPGWIVKPIAEMFEVYYSNLILEGNVRTTLDACAKISKKHKKEFDDFTITADKILDQAYSFMWFFGINRTLAIELAFDFIKARTDIDSDGDESMFSFPASADTVIQYADRGGKLRSYDDWLEEEGHLKRWLNDDGTPMLDDDRNPIPDKVYRPADHMKTSLLEYIGCVSKEVKGRILEFAKK